MNTFVRKYQSDRPDWHLKYFDSVQALVEYAAPKKNESLARTGSSKYNATESYEEAVNLALMGWAAERPKVDAMLDPVRHKLAEILDTTLTPGLDIMGFEPDIGLYLAGELECMMDYVPAEEPHAGKVLNLIINGTNNGNVKTETILEYGCAVVALVESFQILGRDVNVYVEHATRTSKGVWSVVTKVHSAGENMDINAMMFPIAHPSMLRRIVLSAWEQEAWTVRKANGFHSGGGYGSATEVQADDLLEASLVLSLQRDRAALDDPVQWVLEQLMVQGAYTPREER